MNTRPTNKLLAAGFLLSLSATLSARIPDPDSRIQVLVYNYAGVAPETLAAAERQAARIYEHAGIEVSWVDCPAAPEEMAHQPQCLHAPSPDRVALRLVSGNMGAQLGLSRSTFGLASTPKDDGFGVLAMICAQCAEQKAHGDREMYAALLGHVVAHELGHLLLGTDSHGPVGLMHFPWGTDQLHRIAQGALLFTPEEATKMRCNAAARLQAEAPVLAAGN
jgi:hypothetical protein